MNKKSHILLAFFVVLSLIFSVAAPTAPVQAVELKDIVILGTSDLHGNVDNYDYFTDSVPTGSSERGLTKIATYVNNVLASNPNTILIDNGDTIQGNPLAYYFNMIDTSVPNPLAAAMNAMGYVAATVGNHEFNYGPSVFNKYQSEATFPLLSANVTGCADYTFEPYVIQDVGGVQVGILGLTPPAVVHWERPENIVGCVFGDAMAAANTYVPIMKAEGADVIVVAAHTGLDETYGYGREENFAKYLANEVPGIDVILAGHAHANVPGQLVNGVLITEPYYWGRNLSDIRITVSGSGSDWTVTTKSSTTPKLEGFAENPGIKAITQPYHDATVLYINTPIGTATADFPGGYMARVADGPMADLINYVQMDAAAEAGFPVDASCAALFTNNAKLTAGPIKLKDAYAVYIYDNTLYVIEATGQMIKDEIEWTASYFNQYYYEQAGVTVSGALRDYNYDLWSGIEYRIDVTKPVGSRVVELKLNGEYLDMEQSYRVALNNYRATGKFPAATILYQSTTEVRELITNWIMERGTISPEDVFVQNYTLMPPVNTWYSTTTADPVTLMDYADLLWTAFEGDVEGYMRFPKGKISNLGTVNREQAFYALVNKAMADLREVDTQMSALAPYTDSAQISSWAKGATAFAIQTGIFMPGGDQILPKQLVSNAEALAWIREARYPLFTFLSTNDFHGQLETGKTVSSKPVGGSAFDMTYINTYEALNPLGTLLMDAGDIMQGTPISNWLWGASVIDVYNHMGYDVATIGNHEFDWGQAVLQDRIEQAEFPFVLANVFVSGTDMRPEWLVPSTLFEIKGQQVGVIGVTSVYTSDIVMAGNLDGLDILPAPPIIVEQATELREAGADLIVVLAHMPDVYGGLVSQEMAELGVPGVDLIISGHSHSGYTGKVNNVPIIQQYASGTAIGVSDLRYDRMYDDVATSSLKVVTTWNTGVTPDPEIAALVMEYQDEIAVIKNAVKASTLGPISREGSQYTREVPIGNLIADAQAWKSGTQIAFMNPGGIRADIVYTSYPHDITFGDLFTVQPFDNKMVTMTLTGSQIYDLLEQQFVPTQTSMKLLQESGIKYKFDLSQPVGSRILDLTLTDGTPILKDATPYTVACNEYIATGGDKFSVFKSGTNLVRIGVSDLDALVEYIQHLYGVPPANTPIDPTIYPKIEGRIINVTP